MAQQNSMKLACQLTFEQNLAQPILLKLKMATKMDNTLYKDLVDKSLEFLPFWNLIYYYKRISDDNDDHRLYPDRALDRLQYQHYRPQQPNTFNRYEITTAIENWLKPNSMDILMDNFYVKFIAFVCLIGCFSLQHSKTPWNYVTMAIQKLNDEEIRSQFINKLEDLYQKHKSSPKELYVKLADLVVDNATVKETEGQE